MPAPKYPMSCLPACPSATAPAHSFGWYIVRATCASSRYRARFPSFEAAAVTVQKLRTPLALSFPTHASFVNSSVAVSAARVCGVAP